MGYSLRGEFLVIGYGLTRADAENRVLLESFKVGERQLVASGELRIAHAFGQRAFGEFVQAWQQYEVDDQGERRYPEHQLKSRSSVSDEKEYCQRRSSDGHIESAARKCQSALRQEQNSDREKNYSGAARDRACHRPEKSHQRPQPQCRGHLVRAESATGDQIRVI